jgi:hypothetical protein
VHRSAHLVGSRQRLADAEALRFATGESTGKSGDTRRGTRKRRTRVEIRLLGRELRKSGGPQPGKSLLTDESL